MSLPPTLNPVPPNFSSLLYSETIGVVAESGKKRFFIHSNILAAATQSEPPRSTTGTQGWVAKREIDLSDWDGNTVERFLQFLYLGNYSFPDPILDQEEEEEDEDGQVEGDIGMQDDVNTPDTLQSLADQKEPITRPEDANVPLLHAKVYALAQYKGIKPLQDLALERLRLALRGIDGRMLGRSPRVMEDVVELLGYANFHRILEEPIRYLLSTFAAENFEKLMERREMRLLLNEGGGLTAGLVEKIAKRLCDLEKEVQDWKDKTKSDENARKLEATATEKVLQLEANIQQLESKIQQLEATNLGMQKSEAINAGIIQSLLKHAMAFREANPFQSLVYEDEYDIERIFGI